MSIYVEIQICGRLDELWDKTQTPELHQLWDLRFSQITYLPRPDKAQPQRFRYTTRIGFGISISGEGETAGSRDSQHGQRSSALKFWSDDHKSLIRSGSGYWKYIPLGGSVRFLTRYNYHTRFGLPGWLLDRLLFRPLMGWATAWSFDRLRLWIERSITPAESLRRSLIHAGARIALAGWWLLWAGAMAPAAGAWLHIVPGVALLLSWHIRWALLLNGAFVLVALAGAAALPPALLLFYMAAFMLSLLGYRAAADLPSARRCLRKPQEQE